MSIKIWTELRYRRKAIAEAKRILSSAFNTNFDNVGGKLPTALQRDEYLLGYISGTAINGARSAYPFTMTGLFRKEPIVLYRSLLEELLVEYCPDAKSSMVESLVRVSKSVAAQAHKTAGSELHASRKYYRSSRNVIPSKVCPSLFDHVAQFVEQ